MPATTPPPPPCTDRMPMNGTSSSRADRLSPFLMSVVRNAHSNVGSLLGCWWNAMSLRYSIMKQSPAPLVPVSAAQPRAGL